MTRKKCTTEHHKGSLSQLRCPVHGVKGPLGGRGDGALNLASAIPVVAACAREDLHPDTNLPICRDEGPKPGHHNIGSVVGLGATSSRVNNEWDGTVFEDCEFRGSVSFDATIDIRGGVLAGHSMLQVRRQSSVDGLRWDGEEASPSEVMNLDSWLRNIPGRVSVSGGATLKNSRAKHISLTGEGSVIDCEADLFTTQEQGDTFSLDERPEPVRPKVRGGKYDNAHFDLCDAEGVHARMISVGAGARVDDCHASQTFAVFFREPQWGSITNSTCDGTWIMLQRHHGSAITSPGQVLLVFSANADRVPDVPAEFADTTWVEISQSNANDVLNLDGRQTAIQAPLMRSLMLRDDELRLSGQNKAAWEYLDEIGGIVRDGDAIPVAVDEGLLAVALRLHENPA